MFRRLAVAFFLAAVPFAAPAAETETGFLKKAFKNADGTESPYIVYVPPEYDGATPMPVILFLHGSGETKGGRKQPMDVGIGPYIPMRRNVPVKAIVVIPQSEKRTWMADSEDGKRAVAILDEVVKQYKTDPNRTYLTGLSMGGYGAWSLAAAYPQRWAAVVPVCGGVGGRGDTTEKVAEAVKTTAEKIKDIPCWVWHGDQDRAVPVQKSREMVEALKGAGGKPRYTELEGVGHESWDAAYASNDLYSWLLAQKKQQ